MLSYHGTAPRVQLQCHHAIRLRRFFESSHETSESPLPGISRVFQSTGRGRSPCVVALWY